jgi:hypothetical protein
LDAHATRMYSLNQNCGANRSEKSVLLGIRALEHVLYVFLLSPTPPSPSSRPCRWKSQDCSLVARMSSKLQETKSTPRSLIHRRHAVLFHILCTYKKRAAGNSQWFDTVGRIPPIKICFPKPIGIRGNGYRKHSRLSICRPIQWLLPYFKPCRATYFSASNSKVGLCILDWWVQ